MTEMLDVANVDAFAEKLHGSVTRPSDADYDETRALYNAMIDKRPALIARCRNVGDIVDAVNLARSRGLLILPTGTYANVLRFLVPLTIDFPQVDEALAVLEGALADVA